MISFLFTNFNHKFLNLFITAKEFVITLRVDNDY